MATIVAAAMTSHAPNMTAMPDAAPAQRARFLAGLAEMRRRLRAARPDLVVMFVNDHVQNFFYDNLPAYCVGVGDTHWAPKGAATFLKIPQRQVPGASAWGKALLAEGLETGFDLAVSHDLEFWDDVSVPAHFLMPEGTLPIVPVLTNCVAPPLPTPKRSWALGGFIRRFVDARPANERVALHRHRRYLALDRRAEHRPHQPRLGPLGARHHRRGPRRGAGRADVGPDRARRRQRRPGDPQLDRRAGGGAGRQGRDPDLRAGEGMAHRRRGDLAARLIARSTAR